MQILYKGMFLIKSEIGSETLFAWAIVQANKIFIFQRKLNMEPFKSINKIKSEVRKLK